jgi:phosphoribosylaminoimidazole-succinocarboxamide synthase
MIKTVVSSNYNFPGQKGIYKGKVRDVYNINDDYLLMIVSDRISAFDVVLFFSFVDLQLNQFGLDR